MNNNTDISLQAFISANRAIQSSQNTTGCKCTFSQRMAGDGCDICNPELALEHTRETIAEQEKAMRKAAKIIREFCDTFNVPCPQEALELLEDI